MRMVPLRSSNLAAAGHEGDVLEIEFTDGGLYRYFGVPGSIFRGLIAAPSAGRYFHSRIKERYRFQRLR